METKRIEVIIGMRHKPNYLEVTGLDEDCQPCKNKGGSIFKLWMDI